jgi:hypothetical protein
VEAGGHAGNFQLAVALRALVVAFAARWSEGGIFGARDCKNNAHLKIIYTSRILARLLERLKHALAR